MKFDCGETIGEYEARIGKWHPWFAWRPVRLGPHDCRWFEMVWRRGDLRRGWEDYWVVWEYSATNLEKTE